MNGNGGSTSDQIRRDAAVNDPATLERRSDSIRQDMSQTIDALQRNYSPGALLDRSLDLFKEHGGELGANLGRSVKQNPMPALLTLVGVGWMMISQNRQQDGTQDGRTSEYDRYGASAAGSDPTAYGTSGTGYVAGSAYASDDASGTASGGSSLIGDKLGAARDRVSSAKDSAKGAVGSGAHRAAEGAHRAADRAREQSQRAREGLTTMLQEQPFAVGAMGIALGAVIGALLPESEREDRALGAARDRVLERAKEVGTQGYAKAREKAEQATQGARESVRGSGSTVNSSAAGSDAGGPAPGSARSADAGAGAGSGATGGGGTGSSGVGGGTTGGSGTGSVGGGASRPGGPPTSYG